MTNELIYTTFLYFLILVFLLSLQSLQVFSIGLANPDLVMVFVLIYVFSRGAFKGEIFAFFVGMILDIMSGGLLGLNAFVFTTLSFLSTSFQRMVKITNLVVFLVYMIVATVLKYFIYHVFLHIYQGIGIFDWYLLLKIPGEIFLNVITGLILYILISRFDRYADYEWF